jgi:hypothetical protein
MHSGHFLCGILKRRKIDTQAEIQAVAMAIT